jgi:hypothetical protein
MARQKLKIGSIQKTKDGRKTLVSTKFDLQNLKRYLETPEALALLKSTDPKAKKYFNMETKQEQIDSLNKAVAEGKLNEETAEKKLERLNNIPDYVMMDVSTLVDVTDF